MEYSGMYASPQPAMHQRAPAAATSAAAAAAAPVTSALGQELDRLVSGTLAAQDYRDRVEGLTHAVRATDEKVLNLTRLVKLSQSIQEEKEAELRQQNEELRARLKRQEQLTVQLQRQLEDMQTAAKAQTTQHVVASQRVEARATALAEQQEERWTAVQERVTELERRLRGADTSATQRLEERLAELDERVQRVAQSSMEATNQWAKRNFVRFKERVDSLRADVDDVRGGQRELASLMQSANCRAETEYKKVLVLLQRKTKETDALTELVEKELQHLQKVAVQHQILASRDITPTFALDDKAYQALKFSSLDA